MTERDFYREILKKQALDKDGLLEEIKQNQKKKLCLCSLKKWPKVAAAVFCVAAIGSASIFFHQIYQNNKSADNSLGGMAPGTCFTAETVAEDSAVRGADENALGNEANKFSSQAEEKMRSIAGGVDCIVTAKVVKMTNGVAAVQVVESICGSQAGEAIQVVLPGAVEGKEYLLFLLKDGIEYKDLLSDGSELYEADSQQDIYWPSALPYAKQSLNNVREWAASVSSQKKYESPIDNSK